MNNNFYEGLPVDVSNNIYWVRRERRKNPLSFIPGGSDVVVVYVDGQSLAYDWIKDDRGYVRKIFKVLVEKQWTEKEFAHFDIAEDNELFASSGTYEGTLKGEAIIRKYIKSIYAKRNPMTGVYSDNPFKCIWQNTEDKHPVTVLIEFYRNQDI